MIQPAHWGPGAGVKWGVPRTTGAWRRPGPPQRAPSSRAGRPGHREGQGGAWLVGAPSTQRIAAAAASVRFKRSVPGMLSRCNRNKIAPAPRREAALGSASASEVLPRGPISFRLHATLRSLVRCFRGRWASNLFLLLSVVLEAHVFAPESTGGVRPPARRGPLPVRGARLPAL